MKREIGMVEEQIPIDLVNDPASVDVPLLLGPARSPVTAVDTTATIDEVVVSGRNVGAEVAGEIEIEIGAMIGSDDLAGVAVENAIEMIGIDEIGIMAEGPRRR